MNPNLDLLDGSEWPDQLLIPCNIILLDGENTIELSRDHGGRQIEMENFLLEAKNHAARSTDATHIASMMPDCKIRYAESGFEPHVYKVDVSRIGCWEIETWRDGKKVATWTV